MPRLLACLLAVAASAAAAAPDDVAAMTAGVDVVVPAGGIPNPVVAFGDEAFVVMTGRSGKYRVPLFAAARYGEGRVVAGGHESYFGGGIEDPDNARLLLNFVNWLGRKETGLRVVEYRAGTRPEPLVAAGHRIREVDDQGLVAALDEADVVITNGIGLSGRPPVIEALAAYVEGGGGLLVNTVAWGWQQLNPEGDILRDLGGNLLCTRMGLAWPDGMADHTVEGGWKPDSVGLELSHAGRALAALEGAAAQPLEPDALGQVSRSLSDVVRAIPADHPFVERIKTVCAAHGGDAVPSEKAPIKLDNPFARVRIILEAAAMRQQPAEDVTAHPAAAEFPGPVPAEAPRVTRALAIDTAVPAWHSTGLYAAPGELLTVTLPGEAAGKGLAVRIGCHTDRLWDHDQWKRIPEISQQTPLRSADTKVASPFGGLLYIVVPGDCSLGAVEVTVAGAVEAPLFEYGKTSLAEWRETIRHRPAPWGEFGSDKVVFAVPSSFLASLDNPEPLCEFWNEVLDADADLAQVSRERLRPERYVPDVQISAGYMHSGYPIMTWMDQPPIMTDVARLRREGSWGMFHEMGHNHQSGHWTFGGTGEVTVNLFSLYAYERCCDTTTPVHEAAQPEAQAKMIAKYLADGRKFSDWQSNPFLALVMYVQLKEAFGWGAFQRVFAGYQASPAAELPKNDAEKRDQWMVRFSREVGRNLGPFFEAWGVPTSEAARRSIADLPEWMPAGAPGR